MLRLIVQMAELKVGVIVVFIVAHITSLYAIYHLFNHDCFWQLIMEFILLYYFSGMLGITAGAHRLWTHSSYKAKLPARIIMMIANSIANQKCIYNWVRIHRTHHAYADTDGDPHNINRGFFYAHMGWLLCKTPVAVIEKYKLCNLRDLNEDFVVMFQYALDPWWNLFWCFVVPGIYGYIVYGSFLTGFLILGVARWIFVLHVTWTINSVAHTFGSRNYDPNIRAANSLIESIISGGEGSHNFHHKYPYDYTTSEHPLISDFDWNPTKYYIDFLYAIGQATCLKRRKELH